MQLHYRLKLSCMENQNRTRLLCLQPVKVTAVCVTRTGCLYQAAVQSGWNKMHPCVLIQAQQQKMTKQEAKRLVNEDRSFGAVTVEPALFILALCASSANLIIDQYVFSVASKSFNYTESSSKSDACYNQSDEAKKLQENVQSLSSEVTLVFSGISSALGLFMSLLLGGYSDRKGRKFVLLIHTALCVSKYIAASLVMGLQQSYWFLVIYSITDGLSGLYGFSLAICFAYIADITDIKKLSLKVAVLGTCLGIGEGLGHMLSGFLITFVTFRFAFVFLTVLDILNLIYILRLKESKSELTENSKTLTFKDLLNTLKLFISKETNKNRPRILILNILVVFMNGTILVPQIIPLTYFLRGEPLCFSPMNVGFYIGAYHCTNHIGIWIGVKVFQRCVGDYGMMIIGAFSGAFFMIFITFLSQLWMVFVAPLIGIFMLLLIAMIRSASSKLVKENEQGGLCAGMSCTQILATLIGVLMFNSIYSATLRILPGFVFLVMAAVYLGTVPIIGFQIWSQKKEINLIKAKE